MIRAWSWRPAANAAEAIITICPPTLIQPVNQAAVARDEGGERATTQWYCPVCMSIKGRCGLGGYCIPPAVGQMDAISPKKNAMAIVQMTEMNLLIVDFIPSLISDVQ